MFITEKDVIYRFIDITFKVTKIDVSGSMETVTYIFNNVEHWCVDLSHRHKRVMLPYSMIRKIFKHFDLGIPKTVEYLRGYFHTKYDFPPDYYYDLLPF